MSIARTSVSHPLRVDALQVGNGLLGLTFCPGKKDTSLTGARWDRDLETDLARLRDWGASLVITLMERHEFDLLGVPNLPDRIKEHGMDLAHLPIPDQGIPGAAFPHEWSQVQADAFARLTIGGRVIVHCRGGLGRTGLVAALMLIETGLEPTAAIRAVRQVRPGAIETVGQDRFVQDFVRRDHSLGLLPRNFSEKERPCPVTCRQSATTTSNTAIRKWLKISPFTYGRSFLT